MEVDVHVLRLISGNGHLFLSTNTVSSVCVCVCLSKQCMNDVIGCSVVNAGSVCLSCVLVSTSKSQLLFAIPDSCLEGICSHHGCHSGGYKRGV